MRKFCCSGKINPVQKPVKSISPIISTVIIIIIVVFAGIFTEGYVMGYFSNMHRDPPPEAVYIYQYAKDGVINLGLQVISDSPEIQLENTSFLINASTGQIATPLDISPTILNASSLNQITGRPENNVPNGYYYVKLLTRTGYVLCSEIFQINGLNTWSTPAGVLYVQQINITNTQSSKTVMPFDQRITLPPTNTQMQSTATFCFLIQMEACCIHGWRTIPVLEPPTGLSSLTVFQLKPRSQYMQGTVNLALTSSRNTRALWENHLC